MEDLHVDSGELIEWRCKACNRFLLEILGTEIGKASITLRQKCGKCGRQNVITLHINMPEDTILMPSFFKGKS